MDASELVRDARRRHRIDQRTLARRGGTSQSHVARIERGEISPTISTLEKLLAALGERLEVTAVPVRPDVSPQELRHDLELLTVAERVQQAASLSRALTTVAAADGAVDPLRALDLLEVLVRHDLELVVVGAFALAAHGYVRGTDDVDVVVADDPENLERLLAACRELDSVPLESDGAWALRTKHGRLDVLRVAGYDELAERATAEAIDGVGLVRFAGLDDLVATKRSARTLHDLADIRALQEARGAT